MKRFLEYGGIAASVLLIAFGIGATVVGINGRDQVRSDLAREQIVEGHGPRLAPQQCVDDGAFQNIVGEVEEQRERRVAIVGWPVASIGGGSASIGRAP